MGLANTVVVDDSMTATSAKRYTRLSGISHREALKNISLHA